MTQIISIIDARKPLDAAYRFSAILAVDKGVCSTVEKHDQGYLVSADDGRGVLFRRRVNTSTTDRTEKPQFTL